MQTRKLSRLLGNYEYFLFFFCSLTYREDHTKIHVLDFIWNIKGRDSNLQYSLYNFAILFMINCCTIPIGHILFNICYSNKYIGSFSRPNFIYIEKYVIYKTRITLTWMLYYLFTRKERTDQGLF